jgi:protein involved in polysaccharide export with SLBB domain
MRDTTAGFVGLLSPAGDASHRFQTSDLGKPVIYRTFNPDLLKLTGGQRCEAVVEPFQGHQRHGEGRMLRFWLIMVTLVTCCSGCYVPLSTVGVPASCLPEEFRMPVRGTTPNLNLANLALTPPEEYLVCPGDTLQLVIPGMFEISAVVPFKVQVAADGNVTLPSIGVVLVAWRTIGAAQQIIEQAYADSILVNPRVNVSLETRGVNSVSVIGEVKLPGAINLPRYEDDLAHAIARAGGLTVQAAERIEIHRRATPRDVAEILQQPLPESTGGEKLVIVIPLRGRGVTAHLEG